MKDGEQYELIEQRYLLFPQRSGNITLPSPVFSSRDLFVQGEPLTLEVQPKPLDVQPWIVAADLVLSEAWETPEPPWRVGDHLMRTLLIEGEAVTGAQLPDLNMPALSGFSVQKVESRVIDRIEGDHLIGQRRLTFLYLPEQAGEFTLPPVALPWWDTTAGKQQSSSLASRTIVIAQANFLATTSKDELVSTDYELQRQRVEWPLERYLLLLFVLTSIAIGYWQRKRWVHFKQPWRHVQNSVFMARLLFGCLFGSAQGVGQLLLKRGRLLGVIPPPGSLIALARMAPAGQIKQSILILDGTLYGKQGVSWKGYSFFWSIAPWVFSWQYMGSHKLKNPLPPLWHSE